MAEELQTLGWDAVGITYTQTLWDGMRGMGTTHIQALEWDKRDENHTHMHEDGMGITHTVTKLNESHGNPTTHTWMDISPLHTCHQDGMSKIRIPLTNMSPNLRGGPAPWQRVTSCLDWAKLGIRYQKSWMGGVPLWNSQNGGSRHLHQLGVLGNAELKVMRL